MPLSCATPHLLYRVTCLIGSAWCCRFRQVYKSIQGCEFLMGMHTHTVSWRSAVLELELPVARQTTGFDSRVMHSPKFRVIAPERLLVTSRWSNMEVDGGPVNVCSDYERKG